MKDDSPKTIPHEVAAVLDAYPDPAIILGLDYRILAANSQYKKVYGDESPIRGKTCYQVSHGIEVPCEMAGESCPIREVLQSGEAKRVLHVHHTPRGNEHVDVEARPVRDENGEVRYLLEIMRKVKVSSAAPSSHGLVGHSSEFNRMLELVKRVADSKTSVLLLGESGTGKELVAKAIHDESNRHHKAFVPVDCSSMSDTLFESELFGHEKGAFTGAASSKIGLIEAAEGGTLFLDELGDIPLGLQVKLLRVLETSTYRRVGSIETRKADFRLICATHRRVEEMVEQGKFRQDLFYRISAFPIELPPLRERREDIPLLIDTLLKRMSESPQIRRIGSEALACLMAYDFPGNIRELRNVIERALLLADGEEITENELPANLLKSVSAKPKSESHPFGEIVPLEEMERRYLLSVEKQHRGDRKSLAAKLGVSESTLYRKLKELDESD